MHCGMKAYAKIQVSINSTRLGQVRWLLGGKYLLHKLEDLSSDQHTHKNKVWQVAHFSKLSATEGKHTHVAPRTHWLAI